MKTVLAKKAAIEIGCSPWDVINAAQVSGVLEFWCDGQRYRDLADLRVASPDGADVEFNLSLEHLAALLENLDCTEEELLS